MFRVKKKYTRKERERREGGLGREGKGGMRGEER